MKMLPMVMMAVLIVIAAVFVGQGVMMHAQVRTEEATFHALQQEYFLLSKTERDAAPTNSALNQKLVQVQNYPSELLRLKLVGVGKILTGISILLLGILIALIMMPMRLGKIIREKSN